MPNTDLPKVSTSDAPIKDLKVNGSATTYDKIKSSIASTLLNRRTTSSLMFNDEELSNIDRAIEAFQNNQQFVPEGEERSQEAENKKEEESLDNEKSFIYLASIIYFGQKDWAVWINDQKITNSSNSAAREIYLSSVKNDSVAITWKLSLSKWRILSKQNSDAVPPNLNLDNQVELEFVLRPNQTFALNTNKVIEGRAAAALLKKKEESKNKPSE